MYGQRENTHNRDHNYFKPKNTSTKTAIKLQNKKKQIRKTFHPLMRDACEIDAKRRIQTGIIPPHIIPQKL